MLSIRQREVRVWGQLPVFILLQAWGLALKSDVLTSLRRWAGRKHRFRNENVKLNGPCLTSLLIPRNSFPVCGTFPLHPAYVPHSLLCSNSSVFPDSSRWSAVSQACSCHSNRSSGCLVYTSSQQRSGLSHIPAPDEARPLHPQLSRVSIPT